jgi:hypothetical protein
MRPSEGVVIQVRRAPVGHLRSAIGDSAPQGQIGCGPAPAFLQRPGHDLPNVPNEASPS